MSGIGTKRTSGKLFTVYGTGGIVKRAKHEN